MEVPTKANRLMEAINASPKNCLVYVPARHATHFQSPPKNGHAYLVQDPRKPSILHWTKSTGEYVRLGGEREAGQPPLIMQVEIRTQGATQRKSGMPVRLAGNRTFTTAASISVEAMEVSLIDIRQVMRICGFSRSFIHAQPDFPKPVRMGTARRSASRWVESEVIAWVRQLTRKRP